MVRGFSPHSSRVSAHSKNLVVRLDYKNLVNAFDYETLVRYSIPYTELGGLWERYAEPLEMLRGLACCCSRGALQQD